MSRAVSDGWSADGAPGTLMDRRSSGTLGEVYKGWGTCARAGLMRTKIVLDDELVPEAMRRTGIKTKRAVVEEALKTLIGLTRQEQILALRGKLPWEGDF